MPFPVPNLDNRTFQGIVDELKQRIPLYCPEWTDHNVSDPGVTLIELFAYVVEQMLYRMNQIPEQHYCSLQSGWVSSGGSLRQRGQTWDFGFLALQKVHC